MLTLFQPPNLPFNSSFDTFCANEFAANPLKLVPYTVRLRLSSWCCIWILGNDSVRVQFVRWSSVFTQCSLDICVVKSHPDQDGAEPSPNSVAASNLQRLSAYLGRPVDPSPEAIYKTFNEMMSEHPVAIPELLAAFVHHSRTTKQVNRFFFSCVVL